MLKRELLIATVLISFLFLVAACASPSQRSSEYYYSEPSAREVEKPSTPSDTQPSEENWVEPPPPGALTLPADDAPSLTTEEPSEVSSEQTHDPSPSVSDTSSDVQPPKDTAGSLPPPGTPELPPADEDDDSPTISLADLECTESPYTAAPPPPEFDPPPGEFSPSSGVPALSEVHLYGENFDALGLQVKFGDIPATIVSSTNTEIVVRVPNVPAYGLYHIYITTNSGTVVSQDAFNIVRLSIR